MHISPSNNSIPEYVDARKAFIQQVEVRGDVPLESLPRTAKCLASNNGQVSAQMAFSLDDSGKKLIIGSMSARVNVSCQRCLEAVEIEVADDIKLALVNSDEQAKKIEQQLGVEFDPFMCEEIKLNLFNVVDEQLTLCLPIASYHQSGECLERMSVAPGARLNTLDGKALSATKDSADDKSGDGEGSTHKPFAQLASLLAQQQDQDKQ